MTAARRTRTESFAGDPVPQTRAERATLDDVADLWSTARMLGTLDRLDTAIVIHKDVGLLPDDCSRSYIQWAAVPQNFATILRDQGVDVELPEPIAQVVNPGREAELERALRSILRVAEDLWATHHSPLLKEAAKTVIVVAGDVLRRPLESLPASDRTITAEEAALLRIARDTGRYRFTRSNAAATSLVHRGLLIAAPLGGEYAVAEITAAGSDALAAVESERGAEVSR